MAIKYLSLFSGIGGFEVGMNKSRQNFKNIGWSEVDKYAISIYSRHFPRHRPLGDVTRINTEELEDFELLVGGFPCQSFSLAGKRKGFNDTRGTLFFEIARILKDKQPPYFLLENVRNLLSIDNGYVFNRILSILNEEGYDVEWEVYNSADYGVPQKRERVFLKGYSRRECGSEILHQFQDSGKPFQMNIESDSQSISLDETVESPLRIRTNTRKGYDEVFEGDGVRLCHPTSKTARGRTQKEAVGTLSTESEWGVVDKGYRIRKLTPIECERLQGFEDNWTKYGKDDELISDTQRYRCLGNAVTTNVIEHIFNEWELNI